MHGELDHLRERTEYCIIHSTSSLLGTIAKLLNHTQLLILRIYVSDKPIVQICRCTKLKKKIHYNLKI